VQILTSHIALGMALSKEKPGSLIK
jgi:hypothetical protein